MELRGFSGMKYCKYDSIKCIEMETNHFSELAATCQRTGSSMTNSFVMCHWIQEKLKQQGELASL
jgi:hypothetical protein